MKVLKFGGSSLKDADILKNLFDIVLKESENSRLAVVVSASGKTTDRLIKAAELAYDKNESFRDEISALENHHVQLAKKVVSIIRQSHVLSQIKKLFNDLENILEGIYLINDLSPKSLDKIVSFCELLSSTIVAEALSESLPDTIRKDSRELIVTNNQFTQAVVNFEQTNANIKTYFDQTKNRVTILPGFIAATTKGETTTLGRGGSDYTAAIIAAAYQADVLEI